ncbi:MAG: AarF/ABC1/UbiB kinase family protein, partial [Rhodothermales bacterium]|nr:AarF/ABC1/UbiB kinase family protein [Rhodothermales bacterium]
VGRWFGIRGLPEQFAEVEAIILGELDLEQEARHLAELGARLRRSPRIDAPDVVPERSTRRVLTTTFEPGVKAGDLDALDRLGLDRAAVAERIIRAYGQLIFRDGVYHADPHPGNLLVRDGGTVVFLDFGAVARLTPAMQAGLAHFLMGVMDRDAARVTASLERMGFVPTAPGSRTEAAVRALVENVHERVLHHIDPTRFRLADVNAALALQAHAETFSDMDALGVSFRDLAGAYQVPRDWILLERTALLLLGLCTALAPDLNPFRVLWPYVAPLAREAAPSVWTVLSRGVEEVARSIFGPPPSPPPPEPDPAAALLAVQRAEAEARTAALAAAGRQVVYTLGALGTGALTTVAYLGGTVGLAGFWAVGGVVCVVALVRSLRSA